MDVSEFVVKGKAHQIFLSLSIPSLIVGFIPNWHENIILGKIVLVSVPYVVWIFLLGRSVNRCVKRRIRLSETPQQIFLFVFVIIFVLIVMFLDLHVTFYGWGVLIPILMIFSFGYQFYFAAKALTTAEKGKRTSLIDHLGEVFILILGGLGIWFIQPRINKVYKENKETFDQEE